MHSHPHIWPTLVAHNVLGLFLHPPRPYFEHNLRALAKAFHPTTFSASSVMFTSLTELAHPSVPRP
nr:MAG TPA: hypothetical protein [Caudoviricetes sp.]